MTGPKLVKCHTCRIIISVVFAFKSQLNAQKNKKLLCRFLHMTMKVNVYICCFYCRRHNLTTLFLCQRTSPHCGANSPASNNFSRRSSLINFIAKLYRSHFYTQQHFRQIIIIILNNK